MRRRFFGRMDLCRKIKVLKKNKPKNTFKFEAKILDCVLLFYLFHRVMITRTKTTFCYNKSNPILIALVQAFGLGSLSMVRHESFILLLLHGTPFFTTG